MAATLQQVTTAAPTNNSPGGNAGSASSKQNPQLKRIVYSKYRELLGSYNDKANAIIDTLPAYMVREDRGFNFDSCLLQQTVDEVLNYGAPPAPPMSGGIPTQRLPTQQTYEAPACVQNAMMTKDKKPFTYTPGGIDLSQIKSERMAKRLARNAQAEGATGASQMNRPAQAQMPAAGSPGAGNNMGAAAMGMPFQVFPTGPSPPPPAQAGKQAYPNGSNGAPPPPPPPQSTSTALAPPTNGNALTAPGSPNAARKSPTPQRFEPPPMGFRPEIKIPPNPMACLKKVPPPVEKNNFWVEEYRKERSKSPMVGEDDKINQNSNSSNNNSSQNGNNNDESTKSYTPTTTTQQPETNNYNNQQYSPQTYSAPAPQQQQQQSPRPEFRSVAPPQSPSVNVYTQQQQQQQHQTDSPHQQLQQQERASDSPFRFAQLPRPQQATSPLTQQPQQQQQHQQQSPTATTTATQVSPAQAVPWRTQRAPQQQQQQQQQQHPQPIYNNVRSRDGFSLAPESSSQQQQQQPSYQGPKPTNVGSLYIAPLAPPTEPQAQTIVRQQMQQQATTGRDSPMRQMPPQQQQQQQQPRQPPTARWMNSQAQAASKEQPSWARPEENGNVVPSSLHRMKSPPPPSTQQQQQPPLQQQLSPQQQHYQPPTGNGVVHNFGTSAGATNGLRLQINAGSSSQGGPKERIIPIQLEQTPTRKPAQPGFGPQAPFNQPAAGSAAPSGYVVRSPNQFVDQGYNNYAAGAAQPQQQPPLGHVVSPTPQLNAPRLIQQQQQQQTGGNNNTRIIPIAVEGQSEGARGPISQTPVIIQNDQRTPPVQSKSFRILQKITDTVDDGSPDGTGAASAPAETYVDAEPQLQRPQFARQMSAQQARNSPTIEQMRRMQIAQDQQQAWTQGNPSAMKQPQPTRYVQQRPIYNNEDMPQQYVHPSEQQVPEPKKYTGSAIPSRSFKILQAMTTPENAAEMEDSDSSVVELNENHIENNPNQISTSKINSNCKNCSSTTSDCTPTPPSPSSQHPTTTSSSTSSLNSEPLSWTPSHTCTHPPAPHYPHPMHHYAFPWCPPIPPPASLANGEPAPSCFYPYHMTPPPPPAGGSGPNGEPAPNWHYPYPIPPPPPLIPHNPGDNAAAANHHPHYPPPYPYFYPYAYAHPPLPPHVPPSTSSSASSLEYDSQNVYEPKGYPPYAYAYPPYPIITSYSQGSTCSSRASSVLPDIIVTPSTDDVPSQVVLQHHIRVEQRDPPKGSDSLEIEEVSSEPRGREQREGSVIDILTKRLIEMQSPTLGHVDKVVRPEATPAAPITGEQEQEEEELSTADTVSTLSQSSADQQDDETPKGHRQGLQAIKSVKNMQEYKQRNDDSDGDEDDDEDDVTTADGESDIFDEEDEETEEEPVVELELDECIEDNDDADEDDLMLEDELSVIYEEESEMEKSSDQQRTALKMDTSNRSEATTIDDKDLQQQMNDEEDDDQKAAELEAEDAADDSTSVTVRLPLRFSFSRSENDENIATVEVGNSQIEERRSSICRDEKRNSFSVAKLESDEEDGTAQEYDDDCEVSVTISLTPSSTSGSLDRNSEPRFITATHQFNDIEPLAEVEADPKSSTEDVSVSFSLNMRNKFMNQTCNGDLTNNIAEAGRPKDTATKKREPTKAETSSEQPQEPVEELDFFATLRATKMQAQKIKEQSASYWGKSSEKPTPDAEYTSAQQSAEENSKAQESADIWTPLEGEKPGGEVVSLSEEEVVDGHHNGDIVAEKSQSTSLETATSSFWAAVKETADTTATLESTANEEEEDEVDFWAVIEEAKDQSNWISKKKTQTVTCTKFTREEVKEVKCWMTTLRSSVEAMPQAQRAEMWIQPDEVQETVEIEKEDFWASIETAKKDKVVLTSEAVIEIRAKENDVDVWNNHDESLMPQGPTEEVNFWDNQDQSVNSPPHSKEQVDFWAEVEETNSKCQSDEFQDVYDPTKYPEEPREVDTDEEIDFWAEIEAKNIKNNEEITFHKAANFWAQRERQNSIDETSYKPLALTAFPAKLPDEPSVDVNIWAALEAAKGEEAEIIDPLMEEEKFLAEEFNQLPTDDVDSVETEAPIPSLDEGVEEPVAHVHDVANVWEPSACAEQREQAEADSWASINNKPQEAEQPTNETDDRYELEIKRSNYRKAMAFFTTSIDEQKDQTSDRCARDRNSINRNSAIEEESSWDWEAVEKSLANGSQPDSNEVFIVVDDKDTSGYRDEPRQQMAEVEVEEDEQCSSSDSNSTPTNFEATLPAPTQTVELYEEPTLKMKLLPNGLPDLEINKFQEEQKISVRDRIFAFESGAVEPPESKKPDIKTHSLSVESYTPKSSLSRNSSSQRSESEMEEDDSGVTDMNKQLSETDTESESFPELRKMTSYQRAATHSRLFKLLQDDNDDDAAAASPTKLALSQEEQKLADEFQMRPSRRRIVHNVSITRRQNPKALQEAETMSQRRERLSLPLRKNISIDADNPSTPNSPASPIMGQPSNSRVVSDKLVNELVQSLLLKRDSSHLRNLPMEKLQAAAKRVLEEELDSLENTSVETTPAPTPISAKADKSYADYYDSWSDASGSAEVVPSKAFRTLQDGPKRNLWSVKCPRVLSSKTINRDLARVTESPEIFARSSKSPEYLAREGSVSRWRKV